MQNSNLAATERHSVTKRTRQRRKHLGNLIRQSLKMKDVCYLRPWHHVNIKTKTSISFARKETVDKDNPYNLRL